MARPFEEVWLSDDPLTDLDDPSLFGRAVLVERIIEVLHRVRQQSPSSTIGLIGSWGSGKTSVLRGLTARIHAAPDDGEQVLTEGWSVAQFNPWLYSDAVALHASFFAELRGSLPKGKQWKETRAGLATLGKNLAPLSMLTGLVGINSDRAFDAVLRHLDESVADQHDRVAKQLEKLDHPVLMVIDDLDRLSANEILQVFKLVRLVGRLPNVYYLLSYDEQTVIDLLGKTDLVSADDDRRALDYLEKIVQIRLDMPALRDYEVDRAVSRSLHHLVASHQLELPRNGLATIIGRFDGILSTRLRTPRAIKRYFGQLDAFLPGVRSEVLLEDFAIITWLRTFEPGVYSLLQRSKDLLMGKERDALRAIARTKVTHKDLRAAWLERLAEARVAPEHADDVLYLLSTLFPGLGSVYRGDDTAPNSDRSTRDAAPRGVGHPDYFDRYFAFGVPDDDIPDQTVLAALTEFGASSREDRAHLDKLEDAFRDQPELVLRKLWGRVDDQDLDRPPLVEWLAAQYALASQDGSVRDRVEALAAVLVGDISPEDAVTLMRRLADTDAGAYLWGMVRHLLAGEGYGDQRVIDRRNEVARVMTTPLSEHYRSHFDRWGRDVGTPLEIPGEASRLVWLWREADPAAVRAFLEVAVRDGRWSLLDELAWVAPVVMSSDHRRYISRYSDFAHYLEIFDLAAAAADLKPQVDSAGAIQDYLGIEATPENLRGLALAVLKHHRDGAERPS